jgi:hypothetical protein
MPFNYNLGIFEDSKNALVVAVILVEIDGQSIRRHSDTEAPNGLRLQLPRQKLHIRQRDQKLNREL